MRITKVEMWFIWLMLYGLICILARDIFFRILLIALYWGVLFVVLHKKNKLKTYGICLPKVSKFSDCMIYIPFLLLIIINLVCNKEEICLNWTALWMGYSAFGEEFLFRGFLLSNFTSQYKKNILKGSIWTSCLFTGAHVVNMYSGFSLEYVITQCIYAGTLGFCLAVLVCIKQSVIPTIIIHLLINITAKNEIKTEPLLFSVIGLLYFIYGIWLYSKKGNER